MKKRFLIVCCIFNLLFISGIKASVGPIDTTIKHDVTLGYTLGMLSPFNIWEKESWKVDTSIDDLEYYTSHYSLGNPGLPLVPVIFNCTPSPLGFYYGPDYLSSYFKNDSTLRYYNTRAPYLNFFYVTDPTIHQFLDLTLTQNFGKKLNVAIGFKRVRSDGIYLNQSSNLNQLNVTLNYRSKRYMLLFDAIYNASKFDQNGGIYNDSNFINPNYSSERLATPVNLASARSTERQTSFRLQQFYFYGYNSPDSGKEDPLMYVSHTARISGNSRIYNDYTIADDSSGFYPRFYNNVDTTYDSLRYDQFINDFSIGSAKGWNKILKWDAGIEDQWVHFTEYGGISGRTKNETDTLLYKLLHDSVFSNVIVHARAYNTFANGHILFDAEGSDIFAGTQHGDIQGSAHLGWKPDSLRLIKLSEQYSYQTPGLIYELYSGNNFEWQNNFNKITTITSSLVYEDAQWHVNLGGEVSQVQNMVYFAPATLNSIPLQTQDLINIYKAYITKNFTIGKWHLNTKEIFQYVKDASTIAKDYEPIYLPKLVAENSVFYENYLFKHHMLLRVGVDVFYNSSYYVYAYQPVISQYYVQNNVKMGNYFYFDPFITFRIRTFRMFLKMENVTSPFLQTSSFYGYALHYPMPDQVLRFGINWDFWN
ncbi:MAG TPA: putative porin [Bacteroidia bacterium]|nr:putative porin [Bacteroidia bacterium]